MKYVNGDIVWSVEDNIDFHIIGDWALEDVLKKYPDHFTYVYNKYYSRKIEHMARYHSDELIPKLRALYEAIYELKPRWKKSGMKCRSIENTMEEIDSWAEAIKEWYLDEERCKFSFIHD
jgi:hypothetical protein